MKIPNWVRTTLNHYSYDQVYLKKVLTWYLICEVILWLVSSLAFLIANRGFLADFTFWGLIVCDLIMFRKEIIFYLYFGSEFSKLITSADLANWRTNSSGKKIAERCVIFVISFNWEKDSVSLLIDPNGIRNPEKCAELATPMSLAFGVSAYLKGKSYKGYEYELVKPGYQGVSENEF